MADVNGVGQNKKVCQGDAESPESTDYVNQLLSFPSFFEREQNKKKEKKRNEFFPRYFSFVGFSKSADMCTYNFHLFIMICKGNTPQATYSRQPVVPGRILTSSVIRTK